MSKVRTFFMIRNAPAKGRPLKSRAEVSGGASRPMGRARWRRIGRSLFMLVAAGWIVANRTACAAEGYPFKIPAYHDANRHFNGLDAWPVPAQNVAQNAPLPPMGWSGWNVFGDHPGSSDALARQIADALVSTGLKDCGYVYLLAFDGAWWNASTTPGRDARGRIIEDAQRWPNGIQSVCDYIHSKGLKVAGYTDIGELGYCQPAQYGAFHHEQSDANQYAAWGWDYIKVDDHGPGNFLAICHALANNASRRPIVISLSTPETFPFDFAPRMANLWRVGGDITLRLGHGTWADILREFDTAEPYWWAQAPGHWNDLDMMVVGLFGISNEEAKSHFSMWAIRGAPLILGCDIRPPYLGSSGPVPVINKAQLEILKNREVITVDQDPLGASGRRVPCDGAGEVYAKPLGSFTSGRIAVLLLNRTDQALDIPVRWTDLGLQAGVATVRDLWAHENLGEVLDGYRARNVPSHGVVMLSVQGAYDWSRPRSYEAESAYNTFSGLAHVRCKLDGFSGVAAVEGIGRGATNTLQFNRIAAPGAGTCRLDIDYAAAGNHMAKMSVNGAASVTLHFPDTHGENVRGTVSVEVPLRAGETNAIRFENDDAWAPLLDRIIVRNEVTHP